MRAAIIVDGKVDNIIEVGALDALANVGIELVEAPDSVFIGDEYDGVFSRPAPSVDLVALKAEKSQLVNAWREQANFSSFPHLGKLIACDALSRSDIDGVANHVALFGALPEGFPGAWKAVDNSYLPMTDVDAFKSMYASMTARGAANFEHAQQLKAAIAAAATAEELSGLSW